MDFAFREHNDKAEPCVTLWGECPACKPQLVAGQNSLIVTKNLRLSPKVTQIHMVCIVCNNNFKTNMKG